MLERWRRSSLRVHLLVQLSLALGLILVVFLYTSIQALNTSTQDALSERAVLAKLMADRVDAQLNHALQMLETVVASPDLNLQDDDMEPEKKLLQSVYDHSVLFKRIFLLDATGQVLWMAPYSQHMVGVNLAAPPYNARIAQATKPVFLQTTGYQTKTPGVAIMLPIQSAKGGTAGYLTGWIDLGDPRAGSILYPYEPGGNGQTDLVDEKGIVLASTHPDLVGQTSDHANTLATLIQEHQSAVETCHNCHSSREGIRLNDVMAFAPLTHVPWGLALRQPESEVFANTNQLTFRLGVLGLAVLAAYLGLVWMTTRDTVRPMQMLTQACQQIAAGDLSHPIPPSGIAEVATLARSFEAMRQDLSIYKEQTEACQRDLEKRVEERTSELTKYRDYLLKTNRNLTALNVISATLVHHLDLIKTLNTVLERVVEALAADSAGVLLMEDREPVLALTAQYGLSPDTIACLHRITRTDLFSQADLSSAADSLDWHSACQLALDKLFRSGSVLCVPLGERGKYLGCLFVCATSSAHFNADDQALLNSIGWQIAMGVRNARLYEAVQRKERERAEMLHQVIAAQEEERKRIARELHDETSQGLATLMLGLDTLDAALAANPREAKELQETNKAIARQMLENVRRITTDLRPSLLDDMGLVAAVAWYGERRLHPLGITLRLEGADLEDRRLSPDLEITLFRIIQEAMTNVIRHAHASTVMVGLAHQDGHILAQISDDGRGFDPQTLKSIDPLGKGLGLRGMQERVNLLGGQFQLRSLPGYGTTITASVPLQKEK